MYKSANRFMQRQAAKEERTKRGRRTLSKREKMMRRKARKQFLRKLRVRGVIVLSVPAFSQDGLLIVRYKGEKISFGTPREFEAFLARLPKKMVQRPRRPLKSVG
jgi:hypothetical protein